VNGQNMTAVSNRASCPHRISALRQHAVNLDVRMEGPMGQDVPSISPFSPKLWHVSCSNPLPSAVVESCRSCSQLGCSRAAPSGKLPRDRVLLCLSLLVACRGSQQDTSWRWCTIRQEGVVKVLSNSARASAQRPRLGRISFSAISDAIYSGARAASFALPVRLAWEFVGQAYSLAAPDLAVGQVSNLTGQIGNLSY